MIWQRTSFLIFPTRWNPSSAFAKRSRKLSLNWLGHNRKRLDDVFQTPSTPNSFASPNVAESCPVAEIDSVHSLDLHGSLIRQLVCSLDIPAIDAAVAVADSTAKTCKLKRKVSFFHRSPAGYRQRHKIKMPNVPVEADRCAPKRRTQRKHNRIKPPSDIVKLQDRLYYLAPAAAESTGRERPAEFSF